MKPKITSEFSEKEMKQALSLLGDEASDEQVLEKMSEALEGVTLYHVKYMRDLIQIKQRRERTWKERVVRGAALLDEIKPGWEQQITFANLNFGSYDQTLLAQVFQVDNEQKILPLVFAGKGLTGNAGYRRIPGPPPPLHSDGDTNIWEHEICGAHYAEAKHHGFMIGVTNAPDYISSDQLAFYWMDLLLLRAISSL